MSSTLELVLRLQNQASPEVRNFVGDLRGLSAEAQAAGASVAGYEATQNKLALSLLNAEAATNKLAQAQAALSENTDPEKTAALTREVVEARVAVDKEAASVDTLQKELQQLSGANDTAANSSRSFSEKAASMVTSFTAVAAGAVAVGATMKKAFDFAEEGAQLQFLEERYNRLAESIGADSQDMLNALKEASGGMMSDAKLIETASQIISLGLAKNQDSVVDLAGLVTNLGWDMSTVILTFANNSKMRLDSLGLSVTDVEERMAKLEKQGYSTDEAFDMAVIEAGKAKLELLGSAADSAGGAYKRLSADAENLTNSFKEWLATGLQPVVTGLANTVDALDEGNAPISKTLVILNELNKTFGGVGGDGLIQKIKHWETGTADATNANELFARSNDALAKALSGASDATEGQTTSLATLRQATEQEVEAQSELTDRILQKQLQGQGAAESIARAANLRLEQRIAAEEAAAQEQERIAAEVAQAYQQSYQDIGAAVDSARDPISELIAAQADLQDASGEWVEVSRDNSGKVAAISAQLANDLTDDRKKELREALSSVTEGGAEWRSIWTQLQGDLTDSQRAALVAQMGDLEAAHGERVSVFTGDSEAAEEAQQRIDAANAAISQSYRQMAFDIVNAKLAETYGENATAAQIAAIQTQQALGLITQAEADHLTEIAIKSGEIQDVVTEMTDRFLADGVLTEEEMGKIANATALVEGASVSTAKGMAGLGDAFGEASDGAKELKDAADEFTGGSPYSATIEAETDAARDRLAAVKALLDSVDGRTARATVEVNDQGGGGGGKTGGDKGGSKGASGGGSGPAQKGEPEFSEGGYTGSGPSNSFAGRVHYNEFVLNEGAVNRVGRPFLEAINSGAGGTVSPSGSSITIHIDARGNSDPQAVEDAGYRGAKRALAEAGIRADNMKRMQ